MREHPFIFFLYLLRPDALMEMVCKSDNTLSSYSTRCHHSAMVAKGGEGGPNSNATRRDSTL